MNNTTEHNNERDNGELIEHIQNTDSRHSKEDYVSVEEQLFTEDGENSELYPSSGQG